MEEREKYAKMDDGIRENALQHLRMSFADNNFLIRPAISSNELVAESLELHHCVRTYAERVSKGETEIFFVRRKKEKDKPFITVELKANKVIQARAKYNERPSDEVIEFINEWADKNEFTSCFR